MYEILITAALVGFSVYIIFSRFRSKSAGSCSCGNCKESRRKIK
ncbi:FeoB-associated Cys-rich membrane protein [Clostridium omnivorum]|uniref:FeoB-associated Cys-rich membrane protein n=1 Tax=Clostridium omnivorum TaxID=1604902 RepID=A0ABQ5N1Q5_9CLOT|nr:FeoB-associated Cys-rich membrane protein [Clostridium sp. E14]GLC29145.1 hypothetical protein bsdE14_05550 [Clostridium sp. E14]